VSGSSAKIRGTLLAAILTAAVSAAVTVAVQKALEDPKKEPQVEVPKCHVFGHVYDTRSQYLRPLPGVWVLIHNESAGTSPDGFFELDVQCAGVEGTSIRLSRGNEDCVFERYRVKFNAELPLYVDVDLDQMSNGACSKSPPRPRMPSARSAARRSVAVSGPPDAASISSSRTAVRRGRARSVSAYIATAIEETRLPRIYHCGTPNHPRGVCSDSALMPESPSRCAGTVVRRELCDPCSMRHVLIVVVIAGCGGASGSSITLTSDEIVRACVNAIACCRGWLRLQGGAGVHRL
jgi:hypothetical protein